MLLDFLYILIIIVSFPFLIYKIITNERYRLGIAQRFGAIAERKSKKPCIWIHGSSVGEALTGRMFVNRLEQICPEFDIVVSAWTNTGFATARKIYKNKYVFYFPVDLSFIVKRVFKKIRPDYIVLIELEVWPNFFVLTSKYKTPVLLVNGRISDKSMNFYGKLFRFSNSFRKSLVDNKVYCARTEADAARFKKLGIPSENAHVTGTMKYDNIDTNVDEEEKSRLQSLFNISENDVVLVGGSTHNGEEEILLNLFKVLRNETPQLRLILVPRHIERAKEIASLVEKKGFIAARKTVLQSDGKSRADFKSENSIIIVDTIGDLVNVYALAHCVFVGRSLVPRGGQNVMEPAGLAKPVVFGPHMFNFEEETKLLLENNAAKMVKDEEDLTNTIRALLSNPELRKDLGIRAQKIVIENKGATSRNVQILESILN